MKTSGFNALYCVSQTANTMWPARIAYTSWGWGLGDRYKKKKNAFCTLQSGCSTDPVPLFVLMPPERDSEQKKMHEGNLRHRKAPCKQVWEWLQNESRDITYLSAVWKKCPACSHVFKTKCWHVEFCATPLMSLRVKNFYFYLFA